MHLVQELVSMPIAKFPALIVSNTTLISRAFCLFWPESQPPFSKQNKEPWKKTEEIWYSLESRMDRHFSKSDTNSRIHFIKFWDEQIRENLPPENLKP